jgi:hypothetical protein
MMLHAETPAPADMGLTLDDKCKSQIESLSIKHPIDLDHSRQQILITCCNKKILDCSDMGHLVGKGKW